MSNQPHRDANGRFTDGNPGGPGRKARQVELEYLMTMETIVSGEAWQAIVKKATQDAIEGDAKARSWLSAYLLGMPISRVQEVEEESNAMDDIVRKVQEGLWERELEERQRTQVLEQAGSFTTP